MKDCVYNINKELEAITAQLTNGCGASSCILNPDTYSGRQHEICRCSPREVSARLVNLSDRVLEYNRKWEKK